MAAVDAPLGRAERRRGVGGGPQRLLHGLSDLLLVAVGERLHPATAFDDLEAPQVDLDGDGRDAIRFVRHDEVCVPSRGFDDQVVPSLSGKTLAVGAEPQGGARRPEFVLTGTKAHGYLLPAVPTARLARLRPGAPAPSVPRRCGVLQLRQSFMVATWRQVKLSSPRSATP